MQVVVVGAGAWGLPTAAELARRGHVVTVVDRHGPANSLSSSSGPTRLWRLADPEPAAIRLGRRALAALHRLEDRVGRPLHASPGLLWRDAARPLRQIADAVATEGVAHTAVPAASVGDYFPGLATDERDALWFPEAGPLLAAELVAACMGLLRTYGAGLRFGPEVTSVRTTAGGGAIVGLGDGTALKADAVVVCAGPGTPALLPGLGLAVPLRAYLEQVVHLGRPADPHLHDLLPCLFDGPGPHGAGVYAMPTPGVGWKIGVDDPLRELLPGDRDRMPDPGRTRDILQRTARLLPELDREVVDELVCCWTDSPDGWFVVDRVGSVVVACGDSGKGFKYAAALGEILADLAEGEDADADVAAMSAQRFLGLDPGAPWSPTSLGGAPSPAAADPAPHRS